MFLSQFWVPFENSLPFADVDDSNQALIFVCLKNLQIPFVLAKNIFNDIVRIILHEQNSP